MLFFLSCFSFFFIFFEVKQNCVFPSFFFFSRSSKIVCFLLFSFFRGQAKLFFLFRGQAKLCCSFCFLFFEVKQNCFFCLEVKQYCVFCCLCSFFRGQATWCFLIYVFLFSRSSKMVFFVFLFLCFRGQSFLFFSSVSSEMGGMA